MILNYLSIHSHHARSARKAYALVICLVANMALFLGATLCFAQKDIVAFIPPDAPVIAGLHRMPPDQSKDALWLATRNNVDDLKQFVALTNNDLARRLDQVIIADWASSTSSLGSHLVVAQGRFSLASMTSTMAHPMTLSYAGVPVIEIESPTSAQPGPRWLAVPQPKLALFGTPAAVRYALDKYRSGAAADPRLIERLKSASTQDSAWSSIALGAQSQQSQFQVAPPANAVLPCLDRVREVDLGIRIGKTVNLDVHAESSDGASRSQQCISAALFAGTSPVVHVSFSPGSQPDVHVSLTRSDYERWLDSFRKSGLNQRLEAALSAPDAPSAPQSHSAGVLK